MIDINKKYQTRDGRKVKILCTDLAGIGNNTVVAKIWESNGTEHSRSYTATGIYSTITSNLDLIEVPKTYWINIYPAGSSGVFHPTKDEADKRSSPERIACLEFKEGGGL